MAFNYSLRLRAEEDIDTILDYIAAENPRAALELYQKFLHLFDLLAQFPEMGCERPELIAGMRSMPLGNYIIFFEITKELEIVRVLHGARDIQKDLF